MQRFTSNILPVEKKVVLEIKINKAITTLGGADFECNVNLAREFSSGNEGLIWSINKDFYSKTLSFS